MVPLYGVYSHFLNIALTFSPTLPKNGPGGLRSHDFRLSSSLEGRRSIHAELRAPTSKPDS